MGADAFAPWHIILLVVLLVLLFGSRRLPGAARSLGQSMHIFRKSVSGGYQDEEANNADGNASGFSASAPLPPAASAPAVQPPPNATEAQLQDLQRQVAELQRQSASGDAGQSNKPF